MKSNIIYLLLLTSFFFSCDSVTGQQQKGIAQNITVAEFNKFQQTRPGTILDVRTNGEVVKGAIPGSVNIDFFDDAFETEIEKLNKKKPVYIYCASGGRSGEAMDLMKKKGFVEIYNLDAGYSAWSKSEKK